MGTSLTVFKSFRVVLGDVGCQRKSAFVLNVCRWDYILACFVELTSLGVCWANNFVTTTLISNCQSHWRDKVAALYCLPTFCLSTRL
jgi:hypothetical protein